MVKLLSTNDKLQVEQAVATAETRTSAEIVLMLAHSSDNYLDFILFYSMLLADFLLLGLYVNRMITGYPTLLLLQLAFMMFCCAPFMRPLCCKFVPKAVLHKRSIKKALEEFHTVHRKLPATAPLVLLYVSIAERYTHILSSHAVHEKIPNKQWDNVIGDFRKTMRSEGLASACARAAEQIGATLAGPFPQDDTPHGFSNQVIEKP